MYLTVSSHGTLAAARVAAKGVDSTTAGGMTPTAFVMAGSVASSLTDGTITKEPTLQPKTKRRKDIRPLPRKPDKMSATTNHFIPTK
jgi:hypothetical protein